MSNNLDLITSALKQYIVSPLNAFGIGGFVFDMEGDTVASLTSDITDHYTESNQAIQDHIAIRPKRIILRGYVGELVYRNEQSSITSIQKVTQKLTTVSAFLPQLSSAAQQVQQAVTGASTQPIKLTDSSNIYSIVKNSLGVFDSGSNQRNAYNYFQALQSQGILMGIQTPWEFMANMAIEAITAIQTEDTRTVTDFYVAFKQMRFASTQTVAFTTGNTSKQGAAAAQGQDQTNIGLSQGLPLPYSGLPGIQGIISGVSGFATTGLSRIWEAVE